MELAAWYSSKSPHLTSTLATVWASSSKNAMLPYLKNSDCNFKTMSQEPFGIDLSKRFTKASLAVSTSAGTVYAKEEARDLKKTVVW